MAIRTVAAAVSSKAWNVEHSARNSYHGMESSTSSRPLLQVDVSSQSASAPQHSYGATFGESSSRRPSPIRLRSESALGRVLEEEVIDDADGPEDAEDEDEDDDWDLEQAGFYRGSYQRLVTLYTIVPFSNLIIFMLLALLPTLVYPLRIKDSFPRPRYFPFPLAEVLTSVSLWSLSHLLRVPLFSLSDSLISSPTLSTILSTTVHVLLHDLLRLAALPILSVRHRMDYPYPTWHDPAFYRVWWLALGWSLAEVVVGVAQGYEQIGLYRDVMVSTADEELARAWHAENDHVSAGKMNAGEDFAPNFSVRSIPMPDIDSEDGAVQSNENDGLPQHQAFMFNNAMQMQVDRDLDQLMAVKGREELEEVYGVPFIKVPIFVSCLLRLDSIILSLGLTLILSASYLRSPLSIALASQSISLSVPKEESFFVSIYRLNIPSNQAFNLVFPGVILLHIFLSILHTPLVLPRIGVHTAAYVGVLIGLGSFFAGLGMWEALS